MKNRKVWFVTGASKGLGLTLVKQLIDQGYQVAATSRNIADLIGEAGTSENLLPLAVDLKSEDSVGFAVSKAIERFGRIDVVVNNAGYGLAGALEEVSDEEARGNFDVNVFGSLNVIRKVMPQLRKQRSGHVFNISSVGGFIGNFPGFGIYCATKFAVQGLTDSLAAEIKPFGIFATVFIIKTYAHPLLAQIKGTTVDNETYRGFWNNMPDPYTDTFGGIYGTQFMSKDAIISFNQAFNSILGKHGIGLEHKHKLLYLIRFYGEDVQKQSNSNNLHNRLLD